MGMSIRTLHWFITDIVSSADPLYTTKEQVDKILVLNKLLRKTRTFQNRDKDLDPLMMTGDGMIVGFRDSSDKPLRLAIELHKLLFKYNKISKIKKRVYIRTGIHTGPAYFFKDASDKESFWGAGIIMAKRVMDLGGSMQILLSQRAAIDISNLSQEFSKTIHRVGNYLTKHQEPLIVYNAFGKNWGSKKPPVAEPKSDSFINDQFYIPYVSIRLDIQNPKTMLTHHTWVWDEVNVTDKPIERIPCIMDGRVPRKFEDLNVRIFDQRGNRLKVESFVEDKPYLKHIIFKLNRPIMPNKSQRLKLEYDWEEPDRYFEYIVTSECKKFKYHLTVDKDVEVKSRLFQFDPVLKFKNLTSSQPTLRYHSNKKEIRWQASNLHTYQGYRFHW